MLGIISKAISCSFAKQQAPLKNNCPLLLALQRWLLSFIPGSLMLWSRKS